MWVQHSPGETSYHHLRSSPSPDWSPGAALRTPQNHWEQPLPLLTSLPDLNKCEDIKSPPTCLCAQVGSGDPKNQPQPGKRDAAWRPGRRSGEFTLKVQVGVLRKRNPHHKSNMYNSIFTWLLIL